MIPPGGRALVPTGFAIALPPGYEGQVRPRSGLAVEHGVTVLNAPGTIDADYRGEVKVRARSITATEPFAVDARHAHRPARGRAGDGRQRWSRSPSWTTTGRGGGGFGSTGVSG